MFRNLLSRLFSESAEATPLSAADGELAVAALLIRVARADDRYAAVERGQVERILARRRGIGPAEAAERRAAAEMIEAEAPDTVRLTRIIKSRVALEDRVGVVGALWEIAYADGSRGAEEEAAVRLASGLLGVSDVDSNLARRRVLDGLGAA